MRHSVANKADGDSDARMFAPAAARNGDAIVSALAPLLPVEGRALEVASGTGEHVVKLAKASPKLSWHPTEIADDRLKSIAAWTAYEGCANIVPPQHFNAIASPWQGGEMDAIYLANLIHLISEDDAEKLVVNLATICAPGGMVAIYGPFKRGEDFASQGDEEFDVSLRLRNPSIGYKSIEWLDERFKANGLKQSDQIAMPAHNLLTVWS